MKFRNTTDFPDHFLRRMVAWCCREVSLAVRDLRHAKFSPTKRRRVFHGKRDEAGKPIVEFDQNAFAGHGGRLGISVRIGTNEKFPVRSFTGPGGCKHPALNDRIEGLVGTTAHECYHVWQATHDQFRGARFNEPAACNAETTALEKFRFNREKLLAQWNEVPKKIAADAPPKPNITEKRAVKAQADLARWTRKLKLAQTKVKKLRQKVARYGRQASERNSNVQNVPRKMAAEQVQEAANVSDVEGKLP